MRYRTNPCEIEAIQITRETFFKELKDFCGDDICYDLSIEKCINGKAYCWVHTIEGEMQATEGDYIIKGLRGEFYHCKQNIFEKKYELVEE